MFVCKDLNENQSISNEEQLDIAKNVGNIVSNCMQKFMLESREKLQELDDKIYCLAGDACYELERFDEALQFWSRILTQDEKVNERIANAVKKGGRISMPVQCIVRREISLEALDSALRDFAKIVENELPLGMISKSLRNLLQVQEK